jgi:hypothetical protein
MSETKSLEARLAQAASDLDDAAVRYQTAKSFQANQPKPRNLNKRSLLRIGIVGATLASAASVTGVVWIAGRPTNSNVPMAAAPATTVASPPKQPSEVVDGNALSKNAGEPTKATPITKPVRDTKDEMPIVPGEIVELQDPALAEEIRFQPGTTSRLIHAGTGMQQGWFKAREGQLLRVVETAVQSPSKSNDKNTPKSKSKVQSVDSLASRRVRITNQATPNEPMFLSGNAPLILPVTGSYVIDIDAGSDVTFELSIV